MIFPAEPAAHRAPESLASTAGFDRGAMEMIPSCRSQFLPTCLNFLRGRGWSQRDRGHGRVSGGSRHLVDPQASSGAVGSPHGAGSRDVCLRDQHEARRVHHPHTSCQERVFPSYLPRLTLNVIKWIILALTPKLTVPLLPTEASPWTKNLCCHLHHYLICFIQRIWVNE